MPGDNCLVCASDEGVFLDIDEQPELKEKAINCSLDKIGQESDTTKVCYKCAFEIDQCSVFVNRVKKARRVQTTKNDICTLCSDTPTKDVHLFDLSKQKNGANEFIQRIRDLFSDEVKDKELKKGSICLSCRYCVDLLVDLRTLLKEVPSKLKSIEKNVIDPGDLPKTKTIIAIRKTTFIQSSHLNLNTPSDTDSDISTIMGIKKKANKINKSSHSPQKCEKCKTELDDAANTYRWFKTGKTVCEQCWRNTDYRRPVSKKGRKKVNYPKTNLCSILLKDLYQTSPNDEYTITQDTKGNTIFKVIVSETNDVTQESDDEVVRKPRSPESRTRKRIDSDNSEYEEAKDTSVETQKTSRQRDDSDQSEHEDEDTNVENSKTSTRKKDSDESDQEETSVKSPRSTRGRKNSELSVQEGTDVNLTRTSRRRKDSEQSVQEVIESVPTRSTRKRKGSEQSVQEESEVKTTRSRNRKNSEQSVQEEFEIKSTRSSRNRKNSELSVQSVEIKTSTKYKRIKDSDKSEPEEIDVDSDPQPLAKRTKTNAKTESPKSRLQNQRVKKTSKRKRGRSSSVESTDGVRKSTRNAKRNKQPLEEIIEIDDDESDTSTVEKEFNQLKRSRKDQNISNDEDSDAESGKPKSTKASPTSSREPTPEKETEKQESVKETEDSTNVETATKINEKKSKELSSESEEIDILKSTDEESKNDDRSIKRNVSKIVSDVEIESEQDASEKLIEKATNVSELKNDVNEVAQSDARKKSVEREESEAIKESIKEKSDEKDAVEAEEKDEEDNISKNKSDDEKHQEVSENEEETTTLSTRQSSKKNAKKNIKKSAKKSSPTGGRKSRKTKTKTIEEVDDSSDSEQIQSAKEPKTYACTVCEQIFNSKFEGLQHELTHAKRLEITLEKVALPEKKKSVDGEKVDKPTEKMDVDEDAAVESETNRDEKLDENDDSEERNDVKETTVSSAEKIVNEKEDVEMAEVNGRETTQTAHQVDDLDKIETVNDDEVESDKAVEQNESETEVTPNKRGRRGSKRYSSKASEKKTRGKRKTSCTSPEPEVTTVVIEAEPDKIAEAVQETLNDMAELHEKIREESIPKDQEEETVTSENQEEKENEATTEKEPETVFVSNEEPEVEPVTHDVESGSENEETAPAQSQTEKKSHEIEMHDIADDSSQDEVICDSKAESRFTEPEILEHPIVNLDDEVSGDVVDVESEAKKRSEESEIEITEVDDTEEGEAIQPDEVVECEQVDLTDKDDADDAPKADDDNDIEEIIQEPSRIIHEDESTVDSVTEINVAAAAEPTVENDSENPGQNDDEENTTEDEALAQESLEELLQRKGLQVIDEFAESVTDGDDSEKDTTVCSEKGNSPGKKSENTSMLDIKISSFESADILEIMNDKSPSKKSVDGEVQITQDVDVVEEVINDDDDDVQPQQNDVVEEVEVESNNGNCLNVTNNVEGQALQEKKCLSMDTEPISDDDDNDFLTAAHHEPEQSHNSKDMPSLDPICEDLEDE